MADLTASPTVMISIDGQAVRVPVGTPVAVAVWNHGIRRFRHSVTRSARAPLCGMGLCYECRLSIDGAANRRSCTLPCREGMVILTASADPSGGGDHV